MATDALQGLNNSLQAKGTQNQAENMIRREQLKEQENAAKTFDQAMQAATA